MLTDMETFLLDTSDRIWSYCVYRRMFTPYEQDKKFSDESFYENGSHISHGMIVDAIDLGGGKWLLGIRNAWEDGWGGWEHSEQIEYYMLDEIRLMYRKEEE